MDAIKAKLSQVSFNGGELSPLMEMRLDQSKYSVGCKKLSNMLIHAHGPATRRSGTRFVHECGNRESASRLVPFEFSVEQAYVLEFFVNSSGKGRMRVFKDGGVVVKSGKPFELEVPWTSTEEIFSFQYCQTADVMYFVHKNHKPRKLKRLAHDNWVMEVVQFKPSLEPPTGLAASFSGTRESTTYSYKVTAVKWGTEEESLASEMAEVTNSAKYLNSSNTVTVTWTGVEDAVGYRIYRERNGVYGYVGRAEGEKFVDKGELKPQVDDTPPEHRQPFEKAENYPECVQFYEQRLYFARGQTIWGSQTANYENMNVSRPLKDDDAVTYKIAADRVNVIRWMMPGRVMLFGTVGGEWIFSGGDQPVTPLNFQVKRQTVRGSQGIMPLMIGNTCLFVQRPGNVVREFKYSLDSDGYQASDVSVLSQHALQGRRIVDWDYQQTPGSVVWCVCDDGRLLGLSYQWTHNVIGWHRHFTQGAFESVCCIPGEREDEVWVSVRRKINGEMRRFIERLEPMFQGDKAEDAFFVDSGLSLNRWHYCEELSLVLKGEQWTSGTEIEIYGPTIHPINYMGVGRNRIRMDLPDATVDTSFDIELEVKSAQGTRTLQAKLLTDVPEKYRTGTYSTCAQLVSKVWGLEHLEGMTVQVLADGMVHPEVVVEDGTVTLNRPCAVVHIGLGYVSELSPMSLETGAESGSTQGRVRRIRNVAMNLHDSLGMKIGPNEQTLDEVPFGPGVAGRAEPLFSGFKSMIFPGDYSEIGDILIRQDKPLPMTVRGLVVDVEYGG